jgi:hypothetical protein
VKASPAPLTLVAAEAAAAVTRAVAWLEREQLPSGEIPVLASTDPTLATGATPDPSVFPTAVAAQALAFCPEAAAIRDRACRFLLGEKDPHGLWRHWTRTHGHVRTLPPDVDDTSCASAALAAAGEPVPNRDILLANRRGDGLFLTWILPRPRRAAAHLRAALGQLAHLPTLFTFFRATSAAPGDVDAAVNANALLYLRDFDRRDSVVDHLLAVLREGRETVCDKWYENPFAIWYFLSRALHAAGADARDLLMARLGTLAPANALEAALAANVRLDWGLDPGEAAIADLLARQLPEGGWPRSALYHGGRERRRDGTLAPRHPDTPHWGSEALTACFCLEALSRWRGGAAE